jgi:hypothetical protein
MDNEILKALQKRPVLNNRNNTDGKKSIMNDSFQPAER